MIGTRFGNSQQHSVIHPVTPPLTNLVLWLDGADPAGTGTPPSGGSAVQNWVDKSGTGNTASQATVGRRPVYQSAFLNGNGVLQFTASNSSSFDTMAMTSFPSGAGTRTLFAVVRTSSPSVQQGILFYGNVGNSQQQFDLECGTTSQFHSRCGGGMTGQIISSNVWYDVCVNSNAGTNGLVYTMSINGSIITTTNTNGVPNTVLSTPGVGEFNGGSFLDGYIAEILLYNTTLSGSNLASVNSYLVGKWGI